MKKKLAALGLAAMVGMGAASVTPASAHHTFVMFDNTTQILAEGIMYQNLYNNPHVEFTIAIQNATTGMYELYWFEGSAATSVTQRGTMDGSTLQRGDRVQFTYCPLRDGRLGGAIGWIRHTATVDGRPFDPNLFHNAADGGCSGSTTNWVRWLAIGGIRTNAEGAAFDEAAAAEAAAAAPAPTTTP